MNDAARIPAQDISDDFRTRAHQALGDSQLRGNFRKAMDGLMLKRANAFANAEEREQLRAQGNAIRARALSKLPELLEKLEANLTRQGVKVHWAETIEQANAIVLEIAQAHQARQVVKGKSMVSEEMEMNHFLGERGIECLEADMGEFIVQLDNEKPSHIIVPAIHKNARQVARLFQHRLEVEYTEDVDQLIQIGRRVLRQKFFEADIGVSGVNFAVAETGTLLLVENEGNGRMVTTVPPVHIAVTGIEKVVENLEDVVPLLSLLTRSALGIPITTYVNMISGPRQPGELDGPQEVHLVLLDNGRSQAFADGELRQTLNCIRCGACMNHCPVYTRVGGHTYGEVYPGPIGKIITPHLVGLNKVPDHPSASSLCGACGEVCPVKIPIPALLRRLREENVKAPDAPHPAMRGQGSKYSRKERLMWNAWARLNRSPGLYRAFLRLATRLRGLTPAQLGPWTQHHSAPRPAAQSLHERAAAHLAKQEPKP
ncbi:MULTISPECIES: LutB/LldF family L-lactate oxidation iron-sulfur protein [unclassified Pseudomonas]|uniref:LutB/LldF family L-lactate oxidation iron-sulfur protein n=1 Tax=unclassified Pseudomonas TaxID=196821 RepID=UPI000BCAB938|nr:MULTISPECIES: LutB/LldF family L-lactate oxidation iron-sulfur protein [unclassified Pseudomonas]PVZ12608.1 L-lactate dehydrogenase complex protein LldF [Pseudomonas sp. URIL14HWK12:I12]PVZ23240.1 L-lactate dehydrogenase complex protein LldF [Pseudomonas sp. URIL14HWK12:I10]PVZ32570.1 L-lactate dehydrogenase complex protein LldF [Pseudomonas sp. URIL14HWK12:I11]SNZ13688.1 L-lactate dehydrogenase complex protein LldF [Pseudomonas sp. URIL14HWK12:I9]